MEWKIRKIMHTLQWEGGAGWGIQNWWRLGEIPLLLISCIFIRRNDATLGRLWKFPEITPIKMSPIDSYTYLRCWWCGECDPFWSKICQTMWNRHQPPTDACLWDSQCVTNNLRWHSIGVLPKAESHYVETSTVNFSNLISRDNWTFHYQKTLCVIYIYTTSIKVTIRMNLNWW